ncbi:single-stranded DNA-binding protein [Tardisphaera miroshnichenkoae]
MSDSTMPVMRIRAGLNHVDVLVRVIDVREKRSVVTSTGPKDMSEATVGDESGRVRFVLWGDKAGSLKRGQPVLIKNAFVTEFHGELQLNAGEYTAVLEASDSAVPHEDSIPKAQPRHSRGEGYRRGPRGSGFKHWRSRGYRFACS